MEGEGAGGNTEHDILFAIRRINHCQNTFRRQMAVGKASDVGEGQGIAVSGSSASLFFGLQRSIVEWRIGHNQVILASIARIIGCNKVVESRFDDADPVAPRAMADIGFGFFGSIMVDLDACHLGRRETLCHHECDEPRARADVENRELIMARQSRTRPGSEKHSIGAHFHGRTVLNYAELLKIKFRIAHYI